MAGFARADGIHQLMAFLYEILAHGHGSLLLIPGASFFRVDELIDDVLKAEKLFLLVHGELH